MSALVREFLNPAHRPWWHAYGAVIDGTWICHIYGDVDIPPSGADDNGRPIASPLTTATLLGNRTLQYLTSWDHAPSDDELAAVTPDAHRDEPDAAVTLARFVNTYGHAPKIRGKGGLPGGWETGPGGAVYRTDPSCGETRRPGENDAVWYARLVEKEKAESAAWDALCQIPDDDGYTPPPNVRNCPTCSGRVFVARSVDNHLMLLDVEPDPAGELQIYGGPIEEQPTAVYGNLGVTLSGQPLPDPDTHYRRHACDDPYRAEGATS